MPNKNSEMEVGDNTYYKLLRGIVVDNNDDLNIGRVKVRIYSMHGNAENGIPDEDLHWAWPCFPNAGANSGTFIVPQVGDCLLIGFENGDSSKPIWLGGMYGTGRTNVEYTGNTSGRKRYRRTKVSEVPVESDNLDRKTVYKSTKGSKFFVDDTDGDECISMVDSLGQIILMESPMDLSYSQNNGHLEDDNVTRKKFIDWDMLLRKARVLIKNLMGSRFRMLSDGKNTETDITSLGENNIQLKMDTEKGISLQINDVGIKIVKDKVIISSPNIELTGTRVDISAGSINLSGNTLINGSSSSGPGVYNSSGSGTYRKLDDIVVDEDSPVR